MFSYTKRMRIFWLMANRSITEMLSSTGVVLGHFERCTIASLHFCESCPLNRHSDTVNLLGIVQYSWNFRLLYTIHMHTADRPLSFYTKWKRNNFRDSVRESSCFMRENWPWSRTVRAARHMIKKLTHRRSDSQTASERANMILRLNCIRPRQNELINCTSCPWFYRTSDFNSYGWK